MQRHVFVYGLEVRRRLMLPILEQPAWEFALGSLTWIIYGVSYRERPPRSTRMKIVPQFAGHFGNLERGLFDGYKGLDLLGPTSLFRATTAAAIVTSHA